MDEFICNVKYQCSVTGELMLASTCDATFSKPLLLLMQQAHRQQCSAWLHRVGMLPVHRRWHSRSTGWAHCRAVCGWCKWPVRLYKVLPGMEPVDLESMEALALGGEDAGGGACLDWELFVVTRSSFVLSLLLHSNFCSLHWLCYVFYVDTVDYWTRQV